MYTKFRTSVAFHESAVSADLRRDLRMNSAMAAQSQLRNIGLCTNVHNLYVILLSLGNQCSCWSASDIVITKAEIEHHTGSWILYTLQYRTSIVVRGRPAKSELQ